MIEPKIRRVFNNGDPLLSIRLPSDGTRRRRRLLTPSAAAVTQPLILYSDPASVIGAPALFETGSMTLVPVNDFCQIIDGLVGPTATMSDGTIVSPIATQKNDGTGALPFQSFQVQYPSGELESVQIPSSNGTFNGAAMNTVIQWFDSAGGEHAVAVSTYPYVGWEISVGGLQPTLAVLSKVGGKWIYDPSFSLNDLQLAASNPTVVSATNCLYEKTNTFSETYWSSGGCTWISAFPNGDICMTQYFDDLGAFVNACVMVIDLNQGSLVTAWRWPLSTDETGGASLVLSLGMRFCACDPTSTTLTDQRAVIGSDLFGTDGQGGGSAKLDVTAISAVSSLVTLTTASNHGYGVGQWVAMSGWTAPLTALNDLSFYDGTQVIVAVTANTFSIINTSVANTTTVAGSPVVNVREGSPFVELSYNATAKTLTPVTQILLHDQEFGSSGTCIFDQEGNAIFWGNDAQHIFTGSPLRVFLKTGNERSYQRQFPYSSGTFASSYGSAAIRDYSAGWFVQTVQQSHPFIQDQYGVLWGMTHANENMLVRSQLSYPIRTPPNLQPDPYFTEGTLTFTDDFATGAYSTDTLPPLPTGGGDIVNSLKITPHGLATPQVSITENLACAENESLAFVAWMISPSQAAAWAIGAIWFNSSGVQFITTISNPVWLPENTWVYVTFDTYAPNSASFGVPGTEPATSCALAFQGSELPALQPVYVTGASVTIQPPVSRSGVPVGSFTIPEPFQPSLGPFWLNIGYGQGGPGTGIVPQYLLQVETTYYSGVL